MSENGGFGFRGIGTGKAGRNDWEDGLPEDDSFDTAMFDDSVNPGAGKRLPLGEEDRLPWLESPDDVDFDDDGVDNGRVIGLALIGIAALALIVGAIWWISRAGDAGGEADGSLIEASKEPYKVRPQDAGGKVFEGTGDTSFKVSEGIRPQGSVAVQEVPPAPAAVAPASTPSASASPAPSASASASAEKAVAAAAPGTGVQIGAFSTRALAEAAWTRYQGQHEALKGVSHRVVEGRADIGTVYRLQAVAGNAAAARSLCSTLQAGGLKCQVK